MDPITGQATLGNSTAVMQPTSTQICSVYVCNLPEDSDKLTIYENFNQFGAIKNVRVLMDEQNKCKGVGFVNYMDINAANKAIQVVKKKKDIFWSTSSLILCLYINYEVYYIIL